MGSDRSAPQPGGDLLVAGFGRRCRGVPAAVGEAPGRIQPGDGGVDDDLGSPAAARPASRPCRQALDVGPRVAARPTPGYPRAADEPPAHVGVEGLGLHAEPADGLLGSDPTLGALDVHPLIVLILSTLTMCGPWPKLGRREAPDQEGSPLTTTETAPPRGLKGVVVAETALGDVRGLEGFYHYRQYAAPDLAAVRTLEDVWHLLFEGELPSLAARDEYAARIAALAPLPAELLAVLPQLAVGGRVPLAGLRTAALATRGHRGHAPELRRRSRDAPGERDAAVRDDPGRHRRVAPADDRPNTGRAARATCRTPRTICTWSTAWCPTSGAHARSSSI